MATTTFHPFPRLPTELRARIWELSMAEPRVVQLRIIDPHPELGWPCEGALFRPSDHHEHLPPSAPVPAPLQACRESRQHLSSDLPGCGYRKVFFDVLKKPCGPEMAYVWMNPDVDMLDVGTCYFSEFESVGPLVRRLRFSRYYQWDEFFARTEIKEVPRIFRNAREIHVVCLEGVGGWRWCTTEEDWPCELENLWLVEPFGDHKFMTRALELDEVRSRLGPEEHHSEVESEDPGDIIADSMFGGEGGIEDW